MLLRFSSIYESLCKGVILNLLFDTESLNPLVLPVCLKCYQDDN